MILREHGRQTLVCDECETEMEPAFSYDYFDAMIAHGRAEGWVIRRHGTDWSHTCPECDSNEASSVEAQRKLLGL